MSLLGKHLMLDWRLRLPCSVCRRQFLKGLNPVAAPKARYNGIQFLLNRTILRKSFGSDGYKSILRILRQDEPSKVDLLWHGIGMQLQTERSGDA